MNGTKLTKDFFKEHPLKKISAARLTHFRMMTVMMPEVDKLISETMFSVMEKPQHEQFLEEKECLMNLDKAEDIVSYMRKIKTLLNSSLLIQKALACQDDVMPLVLKRICTSGHDVFIENAAILLANADIKYTEQLYAIFPDIRNAYARSELCIVFGVKEKAEYTQLLLEQFAQIKKERPDKSYEQGPLLALYLIYEK